MVGADGTVLYSIGEGSHVKKFYLERKSCLILENNTVFAWRVSTGRTPDFDRIGSFIGLHSVAAVRVP
jgi:hypothetical protein